MDLPSKRGRIGGFPAHLLDYGKKRGNEYGIWKEWNGVLGEIFYPQYITCSGA
jgi:hypothetical protein